MKLMKTLLVWLRGWRYDLDGWLVRARRETDPSTLDASEGVVEESAIAVRTVDVALDVDAGRAALRERA